MVVFIICLSIFILICIFMILYVSIYNRYQDYIVRINEAEANIDSTLRKRFDLLNKSIGLIKGNCEVEGEILEMIVKLRSRKLTNFELDHTYKDQYPQLKQSEGFLKIELGLSESEAEIVAFRKYYNDIITEYNKLVRSFPSNIVASFSKFKEKTYFDGKNMNDDILNDFKL